MDQLTDADFATLSVASLRADAAARRTERYADREFLWDVSALPRCRHCGRRRIVAENPIGLVQSAGGVVHLTNLQFCGSVWACPVCSAKIRFTRAGETLQVLAGNLAQGGGWLFTSLTVPHAGHHRLRPLIETVTRGWDKATGHRAGKRLFADFKVNGYVRALETTHGWKNGWHPHLHVAIGTEGRTSQAMAEDFHAGLFPLWRDAITAQGLAAPTAAHGVDVRQVTDVDGIADYLAKIEGADSVAKELAYADRKFGRGGNRSIAQIIRDARKTGDLADVELINEHELATKRRRLVQMSRGLKSRYAVEERSDEDIVAEEVGGETLLLIDHGMWRALLRVRGAIAELLNVAEEGGAIAAKRFVDTVMEMA